MPVLEVLQREQLFDCIVVVTRYFGGTLLGTGGLVRAYSGAARLAIDAAKIITKRLCYEYSMVLEYNVFSAFQIFLLQIGCRITNTDYSDYIKLNILVPESFENEFLKGVSEITFGKVIPKKIKFLFSE
jgi:putative IMPACT (imprinted ancient) family translation regulator